MDFKYVQDRIIFECIVGSQAYGTDNEFSDHDYSGIMIPGKEYFLGFKNFEQYKDFPGVDKTIYNICKALNLIADNNPNMLDLLFIPERCIVKITPYWEEILKHTDWFLSKRIRYTFSGYAIAQLHRIKTHRKFLLHPLKKEPKRSDFDLPEEPMFPTSQIKAICQAALELIIESEREFFVAELDKIFGDYVVPLLARFIKPEERILAMEWLQMGLKSQVHAFKSVGTQYIKDEYVEQANKELAFYNATSEWRQYQQWKKTRNPKRADLEKKFGYDTKHSMHLVRLFRMGKEYLETGTLSVDRSNIDAEELKEIRNGSWLFEKVEEYAKQQDEELAKLYGLSKLPRSPNREQISDLCVELVSKYHEENK